MEKDNSKNNNEKISIEEIKITINDFLKKINPDIKIEINEDELGTIKINLIGNLEKYFTEEQFLFNLELILSKILHKKFAKKIFLDIDVNSQKEKRINYLKALADELAKEAIEKKEEKIMPPLSKRERKIIHLYLAKNKDIITESQGIEPERKIVIKPKN